MSSPKLIAYKAIIELAEMMKDVVKNPSAIEEAGKVHANALAMADAKILEKEEALRIIEQSKIKRQQLENDIAEFRNEHELKTAQLISKENDLDALNKEIEAKKIDAQKHYNEALKLRNEAASLVSQVNTKEANIAQREELHKQNISALNDKKIQIAHWESSVATREAAVISRENKIKEALNKCL